MIFEVFCDILVPLYMAQLIDVGLVGRDFELIKSLCLRILLIGLFALICGGLGSYLASFGSMGFAADLRQDLYDKIHSYSFKNLDQMRTSTLITRITNDVQQVAQGLMMIIRGAIRAPLMIIFALIMAYRQSAELGSIFFFMIPAIVLCIGIIMALTIPRFKSAQKALDEVNGVTQENMRAIREVKGFVREDQQISVFGRVNQDLRKKNISAFKILALAFPSLYSIANIFLGIIFWIGGQMILGGSFEIGRLSAFSMYCFQITFSLIFLSFIFMQISRAKVSGERIVEVFDLESDLVEKSAPIQAIQDCSIRFDHVCFRYPAMAADALKDINFEIKDGQTLGIIGTTGSGKSSIIQLIPRLYDVRSGAIHIGSHNVKDYAFQTLRDDIALVFQKNELFTGTIRSNMLWGRADASDEDIIHALKAADAYEFVSKLQEGLDAPVERGGSNFSGGQRQRLCIARALVRQPKILILDDSTSAVDTKTERRILTSLKTLYPHLTTLIIAQRISTVEACDHILVLDEGLIESQGTHDELLQTSNIYRSIYESQKKGAIAS